MACDAHLESGHQHCHKVAAQAVRAGQRPKSCQAQSHPSPWSSSAYKRSQQLLAWVDCNTGTRMHTLGGFLNTERAWHAPEQLNNSACTDDSALNRYHTSPKHCTHDHKRSAGGAGQQHMSAQQRAIQSQLLHTWLADQGTKHALFFYVQ